MQNPSTMPSQPQLGTPIPGTTGGLPALGGLSVTKNPMAQELQSYGRGDDTMLVHMTPEEVNSLQGLAMAHGGSLTINPHTGLPEAGWLGKLLPTILGAAGMAFGIPPVWMGALGAVGGTVATGDLGKGLMMGLQTYGGASLGGAAGIGGKLGSVGKDLGLSGSSAIGGGASVAKNAGNLLGGNSTPFGGLFTEGAKTAAKSSGVLGGFTNAAKAGAGFLGNKAPLLAGAGVLSAVSEASKPNLPTYKPEEPSLKYTPMAPLQRQVRFQTPEQMEASGGAEYQYFTPVNPEPISVEQLQQQQQGGGFADGGEVNAAPSAATATKFEDLVAAYNANNPGAITASMKYPVTAPPATEQKYDFKPKVPTPTPAATPTPTAGTGLGGLDLSNLNLGNLGNVDLNSLVIPATPAASARADVGGNRLEDFSNIGDYSSTYAPNFGTPAYNYTPPQMLDINAGVQSAPTVQPTYAEPAYEAPIFAPTESLGMYPEVNSYGGNQFGRAEYVNEFARGGGVNMKPGSFVFSARETSELGGGTTESGQAELEKLGGIPIRGPGDGTSDSIKASIGGRQEARLANGEVLFPPEAVKRIGGGSEKRGTQKLYALMRKAEQSRKKAPRGADGIKLTRGLA